MTTQTEIYKTSALDKMELRIDQIDKMMSAIVVTESTIEEVNYDINYVPDLVIKEYSAKNDDILLLEPTPYIPHWRVRIRKAWGVITLRGEKKEMHFSD